jgi:two-component system CheB/CheR fusion protein
MGGNMTSGKRRKSGPERRTKSDKGRASGAKAVPGGVPAVVREVRDRAAIPAVAAKKRQITAPAAVPQRAPPGGSPGKGIPVVGLGGSAGALDCFKTFFEAMPPNSGAAFVVVQHLAPAHESLLTELLAQHTRMKVAQAADGAPVEPNCVYVIPPNHDLGIRDGALYLAKPVREHGIHLPIDFFLRSLAEDRQERAVCVLLSGAGSDGTLGVRAIRGTGGLTIAQDPRTAQYADLPRSAIATKLVDYVLPPDQMPQAITEYLRQPYVRGGDSAADLEAEGKPGGLSEILATVLAKTGCDFRCYKKSTILRRIERRMGLRRISDIAQYGKLLRQDAKEVPELFKDLLINVTAFFRDADAFEELRRHALAPMVEAKPPDEAFRVWVPGCSTGEEAYSLAMLLMEETSASRKSCPVQVFATDIDEEALDFGRRGVYPESIAPDVGAKRLAKFFVRKEHGYQVSESLRGAVVFASQNLITDPPFSKMDLVSCRNLLIYLDGETQAKLVPLFNFALNSGGYLFLGKSEGVGVETDLFSPVSKKARLFRRRTPARPISLDTPILPGRKRAFPPGLPAVKPPAASYADAIRQALLGHFAAAVALVDRRGQILQFHGQTGKYLDMPQGEPTLNLLETAKGGLSPRLRLALHAAIDEGKSVVLDRLPVTLGKGARFVRVTVTPLARRGEAAPLLAVFFEDVPRPVIAGVKPGPRGASDAAVRRLEEELRATQQDLQSSIVELQSANEELRVSNEEVVSTNEELQSTNEELETSKEELQSVNEELTTVNAQLQEKAERLAAANSDLANLLKSTQIATLFLDKELRIKFFTPATERVMKLIPSDMGRPISDLSTGLLDYDLTADARAVARGGPVLVRDVHHGDGSIYHVRVMPCLAQEDRAEGVVVTFDDVTRLRRAEERTRRLATVLTDSNDGVVLFDLAGAIQAWNRGAQAMYGWSEEEALRMNIRDLAPAEEKAQTDDLIRQLGAGEAITSFETKRRAKDGRVLDVWLTISVVLEESKKVVAIAATEHDITERKHAEAALREANETLERRVAERTAELSRSNEDLNQFASVAGHDLQEPLRMVGGFLKLLQERCNQQLDDKAREYIGHSVDGALRMSQLITDLLAYSRVTTNGDKVEPVDANRPLTAALANLCHSIEQAGAMVTHDELPTVPVDASQLTQLFQNLIANAVKFRVPDRPCRVHVRAQKKEGQWVFSVRDNGIGIDPKQFDRVFVIFQRLHTREKYPGTGVGLAICKRIVERHGGRIWVESKVAEGSTFFFTLPA